MLLLLAEDVGRRNDSNSNAANCNNSFCVSQLDVDLFSLCRGCLAGDDGVDDDEDC